MDKMIEKMYDVVVQKQADMIEKQMVRYIQMMTTMRAEIYVELDKRGFKIDLLDGSNGNVLVVIYRK